MRGDGKEGGRVTSEASLAVIRREGEHGRLEEQHAALGQAGGAARGAGALADELQPS